MRHDGPAQPWLRVRSQVDVFHLVRSTGAIMSNPHLNSVKSCPEKSRPIKYGGQMHGVMIAIEYSYKLDRKNYFNLWCKLGRLLLHISLYNYYYKVIVLLEYINYIPYKKNIGEELNLANWRIEIKSPIFYLANIFCTRLTQNLAPDPSAVTAI